MESERGIDMLSKFNNSKSFLTKNKQFIYIGIVVIVLITVITFCISNFSSKNNVNKSTVLTALDNSFTIEVPNSISYEIINDTNFVIDIASKKDEMFILVHGFGALS